MPGLPDEHPTTACGPISRRMQTNIANASAIRRMFEEGARLKSIYGDDNVFDFSLGNPSVPPPRALDEKIADIARKLEPGDHRYMNNAGLPEVRKHVAAELQRTHQATLGAEHVIMTCGAAGALNILLKSVLDDGDEVLLLKPYFPEYLFYVENHGGKAVFIDSTPGFKPDAERVCAALTPRTRLMILNTPNNPTGVAYDQKEVDAIGAVLDAHSARTGRPVYLVMDEPYRVIRYTEKPHPSVFRAARNAVLVTSFSKDLGLAGERIGYLAMSPAIDGVDELAAALAVSNRILGFVNAPALMQRLVPFAAGLGVSLDAYKKNRDRLYGALSAAGYEMPVPEGAFFLFAKTPDPDDREFCRRLCDDYRILCVPGSSFGAPGYMRVSYAVPERTIERAIPHFAAALAAARAAGRPS